MLGSYIGFTFRLKDSKVSTYVKLNLSYVSFAVGYVIISLVYLMYLNNNQSFFSEAKL